MAAILILLIISAQFAFAYFVIRGLIVLERKIAALNDAVVEFTPKIQPMFEGTRNILQKINKAVDGWFKHADKFKLMRNIMLLKSIITAFILFKKRKNILKFFSLYNIVSKFTKVILEI